MKIHKLKHLVLIVALACVITCSATYLIANARTAGQFRVYYSLDKRSNDKELIKVIDGADKYLYFAIYYFTKNLIAEALVRAKERGVNVIGIMDREASGGSNAKVLERLQAASIKVLTQRHQEGIMHVKALVTENAYASGSYNWTDSANNVNDEVLEIGTNESVRKQYFKIITNLLKINN